MHELKPFRFIKTLKANTSEELDSLLSKINMPCEIIAMFIDEGIHYATINPIRPLKRKVIKKSPRDSNKTFKVNEEL